MYIPNNIEFRIVSSGAISRFKQNQAFDFNEIAHNEKFVFCRESKEILLLNYEVWFKTIMKLERLFVRTHGQESKMTIELIKHTELLIDDCQNEIEDVMAGTPAVFGGATKNIVQRTNFIFMEHLYHLIEETEGETIHVAFPKLVNAVSNSLHNLLFQLHEIEELHKDESQRDPFLSYTTECKEVIDSLGRFPLSHRAQIYNEVFGVDRFYVKNYTDEPVHRACVDKLTNDEITITSIEKHN